MKRDQRERMQMSPALKEVVDGIVNCPTPGLARHLDSLQWNRPKGDLLQWVSVLNRFDEELERLVERYGLTDDNPRLQLFSDDDVSLATSVLSFTYTVLDRCPDRSLYNSGDRIYALVMTPTIVVRLAAMKVAVILGERYARSSHAKYAAPKSVRHKVLEMAHSYPPQLPTNYMKKVAKMSPEEAPSILSENYSYLDTINPKKAYPSRWRSLSYEYFDGEKKRSKLATFSVSEDEVKRLSYQQILDKAAEAVPPSHWLGVSMAAAIAKAFNSNSFDSLKLRQQLLETKAFATGFLTGIGSSQFVSSKVFETEVYIFSFLVDLIAPANHVPQSVFFAAIKALQCISGKRMWVSDLIRCMGGNVSHGVLFEMLRHVHTQVSSSSDNYDEDGYIVFFNLLGNLIHTKASAQRLASGGMLAELAVFLRICHGEVPRYTRTVSAGVYLLVLLLESCPDQLDEFVNMHGFGLVIDAVKFQTQWALADPSRYGGAPKDALVTYSLGFRQAELLEMLFGLVRSLIQSDSGDRLRNLFDSPLLAQINAVIQNPTVFGAITVAAAVDCVYYIIHNEPTAFSILREAGVVDSLVRNYKHLFLASDDVAVALTNILSAISLHKMGLEMIIDEKTIDIYFEQFNRVDMASAVMRESSNHTVMSLGCAFDELGRHHPELRPHIVKNIAKLVDRLPGLAKDKIDGVQFYAGEVLLYREGDDQQANVDNGTPTNSWATSRWSYVFDFAFNFLGGIMEGAGWAAELVEAVPFIKWADFLTISNLPYDFCGSEGVSTLMAFLKYIDDEDREYGLPVLVQLVNRKLYSPSVSRFLEWSSTSQSYFSQFTNVDDATDELREISSVANLLFTMAEVYVNPGLMFYERMVQMGQLFGGADSPPSLVSRLCRFFSRAIIEETVVRSSLNDVIMENTTPAKEFPSYHPLTPVVAPSDDPTSNKPPVTDSTAPAFKNTLQIRQIMMSVMSSAATIISCLARTAMNRRCDFKQVTARRSAAQTSQRVAGALVEALKVVPSQFESIYTYYCYVMSMVGTINGAIYHRGRVESSVQTSVVLSIAQHGGWPVLARHLTVLWRSVLAEPGNAVIEVAAKQKRYTTADTPSIIVHATMELLKLFSRAASDSYTAIPHSRYFFPSISDADEAVVATTVVQVRSIALWAIDLMCQELTSSNSDRISKELAEVVVDIGKSCYPPQKSSVTATLPMLSWANVSPPEDQVKYLEQLGMDNDAIFYFFASGNNLANFSSDSLSDNPHDLNLSAAALHELRHHLDQDNTRFDPQPWPEQVTYEQYVTSAVEWGSGGKFIHRVTQLASVLPSSVEPLSRWLMSAVDGDLGMDADGVVEAVHQELAHRPDTKGEENILTLLGILLGDDSEGDVAATIYDDLLLRLYSILTEEGQEWISPAISHPSLVPLLQVLQRALVLSRVPPVENAKGVASYNPYRLNEDKRDALMQAVSQLRGISSVELAEVVTRCCIVYAQDYGHIQEVLSSAVLTELLAALKRISTDSKIKLEGLKKSMVILLRTCFESTEVLKSVIGSELGHSLFHGAIRPRRDLQTCLRQTSAMVVRSPSVYVQCISKEIRLEGYTGSQADVADGKVLVTKTPQEDCVEAPVAESKAPFVSTGVVHLLLAELMKTSKKNWTASPPDAKPSSSTDQADLLANADFGYMSFLVLCLTELVGSYINAKLELLTYTKKKRGPDAKPRSTALNFFLHQLVPKIQVANKTEAERSQVVSSLAKMCLLALVSTPVLDSLPQPKKENADMAVIRKYFVDICMKTLEDTVTSSEPLSDRYHKLGDILETLGQIVSPKARESAYPLLSKSDTKWDQYYLTKALLDADIGGHICTVVSSVDLNFPDWDKVTKLALKPIISLAKVKLEFSEYLGVPSGDDADDEVDVESVTSDTPDIFKHSSLAMYDIDESEEDDDDDEFGDEFDGEEFEGLLSGDDHIASADDESSGLSELESDEEMAEESVEEILANDSDSDQEILIDEHGHNLEVVEEISLSSGGESEDYYEDMDVDGSDNDQSDQFDDIDEDEDANPPWPDEEDEFVTHRRRGPATLDVDEVGGDSDSDNDGDYGGDIQISQGDGAPSLADLLDSFLGEGGVLRNSIRLGLDRAATLPLEMENLLHLSGPRGGSGVIGLATAGGSNDDGFSHMYVKSTKERWVDSMKMFYSKDKDVVLLQVVPAIVAEIEAPSLAMSERLAAEEERQREKRAEAEQKRQDEERQRQQVQQAAMEAAGPQPELEPVVVHIGDREVNIAGTDIDPEFFEALPEEIREEVLTQHVRERRAQAAAHEDIGDSREIDPDFLDALPESIRQEVLHQESMARQFSGFTGDTDGDDEDEDEPVDQGTMDPVLAPAKKMGFTPLVDKTGVSALVRLLFAPMSNNHRDHVYHAMQYLSHNSSTAAELINQLMGVIYEALVVKRNVDKMYSHRAHGSPESNRAPLGSSVSLVCVQAVEAIEFLVEKNTRLRRYLLSEHENSYIRAVSSKKGHAAAPSKYAINHLLALLATDEVKQEQTLLDLITGVIQVATRPLSSSSSRLAPAIPSENYRNLIGILTTNDCSNLTFRKAISAMQNMKGLSQTQHVFCSELSTQATRLAVSIITDLDQLKKEIVDSVQAPVSTPSLVTARLSSRSSDQAKLLRILTALDYMFDDVDNTGLTEVYTNLALGRLWKGLSDCLKALETTADAANLSTALLPLIESLMVVCKHSKVRQELPSGQIREYDPRKPDFTTEPIERLFYTFTDEHKKILNQMVRTNPTLMSGPFGMLVGNPKVLEFDNKKNYFDRKLHNDSGDPHKLAFQVRRDQVFLDSFRSLFFKPTAEFRTAKLEVTFRGESGVDAGGVTREWYQVLSRQMFNPDYALFTPVASDSTTFHPNRTSWVNPEHLSFFKFIGRIIGKAIFDGCYLDCHFSRAVYKLILSRGSSLKDMESLDLDYYKSLVWMLENDITDIITEDFSVEADDYGEHRVIDLVPDGRNIPVTEENKQQYVRKVVEYRLQESVAEQMENFLMGFHEIIPKDLVSIFDEQELELLISGLPDIYVEDWQAHTVYSNYAASSEQIQWFWRAVKSFDNEERAKLLQFATGTSKVPLNGFKDLAGASGTCKFSIHRDYGATSRLPSSHTCFNQIDLPAYTSYEELRGALLLAITEGHEGFGLA